MRFCTFLLILCGLGARAQTTPRDFVRDFGADQKAIWTSPRHAPKHLKLLAPLAIATGVLLATDHRTSTALPNTRDQLAVSSDISTAGIAYIAAVPSALFLGGAMADNRKARDTGFLAGEALADSGVALVVMKFAFMRERPNAPGSDGDFFKPRLSPSFPSGHAMLAWTVSSVVAHRYSSSRAIVISSYVAASAISLSRFTGRQHFASDIAVGSALGWLIGRYAARRPARKDD